MNRIYFTAFVLFLPLALEAGSPMPIQVAAAKNPEVPVGAIEAPVEDASRWTFGAGLLWRQLGDVSFENRSQARVSDLPSIKGPRVGGGEPYRNGYVRPDSSGGSSTWNWGFDDASQASGNLLSFQGSRTEVRNDLSARSFDADWSEDLAGVGFFTSLESPELLRIGGFGITMQGAYSFTQDEVSQQSLGFQARRDLTVTTVNYTDSYDISSIAPVAPQQGTFNGPGPLISTTPVSRSGGKPGRTEVIDDSVYSSYLEQILEVRLHTLSLGPRVSYQRNKLRLSGGVGFGLNIADWESNSVEELKSDRGKHIRRWQERDSGTEVLGGAYAELSAEYQLTQNWSVFGTSRYDFVQDFSGGTGHSSFDIDLGGWTAMLGVALRF